MSEPATADWRCGRSAAHKIAGLSVCSFDGLPIKTSSARFETTLPATPGFPERATPSVFVLEPRRLRQTRCPQKISDRITILPLLCVKRLSVKPKKHPTEPKKPQKFAANNVFSRCPPTRAQKLCISGWRSIPRNWYDIHKGYQGSLAETRFSGGEVRSARVHKGQRLLSATHAIDGPRLRVVDMMTSTKA